VDAIGDLERIFAVWIYPNRVLIAILLLALVVAVAAIARRRGFGRTMRRHPRAAAAILVVILAVGLPVGWYLASPLFLSTSIDEPPPVALADPSLAPVPVSQSDRPLPSPASTAAASPSPMSTPVLVELSGTFTGADEFHFGEGTARLIETSPGSFTVRLEDFAVRNGPDLFVYLSPAIDGYAEGAIELARLKADRGNQNYVVPRGVDIGDAASVVIWCKQFSVLFASAPLS
jgi:hypothetical protein